MTPIMGDNPRGYQIATPDGRWLALATPAGRTAPATDEERAQAFRTMIALFRPLSGRGQHDHHQGRRGLERIVGRRRAGAAHPIRGRQAVHREPADAASQHVRQDGAGDRGLAARRLVPRLNRSHLKPVCACARCVPPERRAHDCVAFLNNLDRGSGTSAREADMPSANRFALLRETRAQPSGDCRDDRGDRAAFCWADLSPSSCSRRRSRSADARRRRRRPPPKPRPRRSPSPRPPAPLRPATASASTDCDQQTWPHLSRACMEEMRGKNRAPRVISTDKLDKPTVTAIEARRRSRRDEPKPRRRRRAAPAVPCADAAVAAPPAAAIRPRRCRRRLPPPTPAAVACGAHRRCKPPTAGASRGQGRGQGQARRQEGQAQAKAEAKRRPKRGSDDDDDATMPPAPMRRRRSRRPRRAERRADRPPHRRALDRARLRRASDDGGGSGASP